MACRLLLHRSMRDIDSEFDSTDVVRYVSRAPARAIENERTQPVSVSMVMPSFDDSDLEAVLAQLDAETDHKGNRV
jgi:GTP-sensing pleiotropic transcriptional regulator CodY